MSSVVFVVAAVYVAEDGEATETAIAALLDLAEAAFVQTTPQANQVYDVSFEFEDGSDLPGAIRALKAEQTRAPPGSHAAFQLRRAVPEFDRALALGLKKLGYGGESSNGGHARVEDHFAAASKVRRERRRPARTRPFGE